MRNVISKALGVLVALAAVAVGVLAFIEFDATDIGAAALQQAGTATGIDLDASSHRIRWLRGLELENVDASARFPGGRYVVSIPSMRFEHRVLPLLRRRLEVERIVLVEPRVAIVTGFEPRPSDEPRSPRSGRERRRQRGAPTASGRRSRPVHLEVRELTLLGAALSLNDGLSLRGVDLTLSRPGLRSGALTLLHALSGTGRLAIEEMRLRTTRVRNVRMTYSIERGRIELAEGAFETARGAFDAEVHLDINSIPPRYRLSLTGSLVDVPGDLIFQGEGFGLDATTVKGTGQWNVPAGRFDDAPVWRELGLVGSTHEAMVIPFAIADGRLVAEATTRVQGSVGLDGRLDLVIDGQPVTGTWSAPVASASGR